MHRLTSPTKFALAGCIAAALSATPAGAAIVMDFESEDLGPATFPTAYTVLSDPSNTSLSVVSKEFTGGPTSQALRIYDGSAPGATRFGLRSVDDNGSPEGLTSGTLSLTLETTAGSELRIALGSGYQNVANGQYVGFSERAFMLVIAPGEGIRGIGNAGSPAASLDPFSIAPDTKYQLEIQFDAEAHRWGGTLNGVAITSGGDTSIAFNSASVNTIRILEFSTAGSATEAFVDNINLNVPEPGSLGLLGLGTLLLAGRARSSAAR